MSNFSVVQLKFYIQWGLKKIEMNQSQRWNLESRSLAIVPLRTPSQDLYFKQWYITRLDVAAIQAFIIFQVAIKRSRYCIPFETVSELLLCTR